MLIGIKKAQSTAEYAILFGLVIAAALAMQTYVKRSLNAKVKAASDMSTGTVTVTDVGSLVLEEQYEPYYSSSFSRVKTTTDITTKEVNAGGNATTETDREYSASSFDRTGEVEN